MRPRHSYAIGCSSFPSCAFWIGLAIYVVLSQVPGTTGKSIVYGWLFGFWRAMIQVNVALTAAALISFFISRYLFRDAIQSRFGYYLTRFDREVERNGGAYVATLRIMHFPYTFVNYAMGASSIRWTTFWWATQLGLLPGNVVFVLAGSRLPTLAAMSQQGGQAVLTPQLLAALALMSCFPFAVRWGISRIRARQGTGPDDPIS